MKYAVNWYDVGFHAVLENEPPLEGAVLEAHPFGVPPREMRQVWTIELPSIEQLLPEVRDRGLGVALTYSPIWSGANPSAPGEQLFGLSIWDHVERIIDPRDRRIGFMST